MHAGHDAPTPAHLPGWAVHPLLDGLTPALLERMRRLIRAVRVRAGEVVFRAGEPCSALYIVADGRLRSVPPEGPHDLLTTGESISEIEFLTDSVNTGTLTAEVDSVLYMLRREDFIEVGRVEDGLTLSLVEAVLPRLERRQVAQILNALTRMNLIIPQHILYSAQLSIVLRQVFGQLSAALLNQLQRELEWMTLETGEVLFRQGDGGNDMCIVVNGRLRVVFRDGAGIDHTIGEVVSGDTVGEFALLTDEPRSATVHAVRETHVVRVSRDRFFRLIDQHPATMLHFTQNIIRRQQRTQNIAPSQIKHTCLTIALVPVHGTVPASFAQSVSAELAKHGATMLVDTTRFDHEFGLADAAQTDTDAPLSAVIAGWLSNLENDFDTLLYVAEPGWTPWTRRCLRQADRVYLVADTTQSPDLTRTEQAVRELYPNLATELVLLHPPATKNPSGTSSWLSQRSIRAHHHLRLGDGQHIRRLVRRMTGRSIGLVMSGGGARGFAHIGVIKALEELGVEIDLLCGTSIGGLVGAAHQLAGNAERLINVTSRFASNKALFDYTPPFLSLMASRKISQVYREVFGEVMIEDFWTPFFAVSSNISRAVPMVHKAGSARRAIRATTAIPGIFTPLLFDGDVVVDGGLLDNFPLTLAREFLGGGGKLIGVLASPLNENIPFYNITDEYVSGWRILFNRLNPMAKRLELPSMPGLVMRSIESFNVLRIKTALQSAKEDLIIQLETSKLNAMDFSGFHNFVEVGYRLAKPEIEAWVTATGPAPVG